LLLERSMRVPIMEEVGLNRAWLHRVDPHLRRQLPSEVPRKPIDPCLRCRIVGATATTDERRARRYVDDRRSRPPRQVRNGRPATVEGPTEVRPNRPLPDIQRYAFGLLDARGAGIVDQHVETVTRGCPCHALLDRLRVRHVHT